MKAKVLLSLVTLVFLVTFCFPNLKAQRVIKKFKSSDLVISKIIFSPGRPTTADEITFWVFVKNIGNGKAGPSRTKLTIGRQSFGKVSTYAVPALNPGQEFKITRKITLSIAKGYSLRAYADFKTDVVETNERNNEKEKTFAVILPPKPDLIISKINFSPGRPTTADEITFWVFVKNIGKGKAGPSRTKFTIGRQSFGSVSTYSIVGVPTFAVPALNPGQEFKITRKITLSIAKGYSLRAYADFYSDVAETKERNNGKERTCNVN